jgi:hypothetical protein
MKQLKALMIKEWNTHWTTLMIPVWFTGGIYLIGLLAGLISLIKNGYMFVFETADVTGFTSPDMLLYMANSVGTVVLGYVAVISAMILADAMINGGFKRKCEIMHLSQPVSIMEMISVKYLWMTAGMFLMLGVLSFVNSLIITSVAGYYAHVSFISGLAGWWQSWLDMCLIIIFAGSLAWFFAGIFKRKSFFMGVLVIAGIEIAKAILNGVAGLHLPSLAGYLISHLTLQSNFDANNQMMMVTSLDKFIAWRWDAMLSWFSLQKIILSAVFFAAGAFFYKKRQVF